MEKIRDVLTAWFVGFFDEREKDMDIYAMLDVKRREYGGLVLERNEHSVRRSVLEALKSPGTLREYPEDFQMYCLGVFDPETGLIIPERVPRLVFNVSELVAAVRPPLDGSD